MGIVTQRTRESGRAEARGSVPAIANSFENGDSVVGLEVFDERVEVVENVWNAVVGGAFIEEVMKTSSKEFEVVKLLVVEFDKCGKSWLWFT